MNKRLLLSAVIAGVVAANAHAGDKKKAEHHDDAPMGECSGINECKGKGACGGEGHDCAGKNTCKGKGWVKQSEAKCKEHKGTWKKIEG